MTFTQVTLTRDYDTPTGEDPAGYVTFTPTAPMVNSGVTVVAAPVRANLDVDGHISVTLTANTDPGTVPASTAYLVIERIVSQAIRQYYVTVPHDAGGTLDLGELDPSDAAPPTAAALSAHIADSDPHPGLGLTLEQVRDQIGTTLVAGTGVSKTVDDPGDTVTIGLDSDLSTIAGLTATTDNFIQAKSSAWASRTPAQVGADLTSNIIGKACRVYASSSGQSIADGDFDAINVTHTDFNDDVSYFTIDLTANTVTAVRAGLYSVSYSLKFAGGSTGARYASISNGGTQLHETGSLGTYMAISGNAILRLGASTALHLSGYVEGSSVDVDSSSPWETGFTVAWLGA